MKIIEGSDSLRGLGIIERKMHMPEVKIKGEPAELTVVVPRMYLGDSEPEIWIGISKVGGGTVGKSYSGTWEYRVISGGVHIEGADLRSGAMGATHEEMIRTLASFLYAAGESLY